MAAGEDLRKHAREFVGELGGGGLVEGEEMGILWAGNFELCKICGVR